MNCGINKTSSPTIVAIFLRLVYVFAWSLSLCNVSHAAAISPLLKCLGNEELHYHKQSQIGPNYQLNQFMINTMAGANDLVLNEGVEEKICHHPKLPPSVAFLRLLLLEGIKIFKLPVDPLGGHSQSMNIFWALETELPTIFFNYLSNLQSLASNPHCLVKNVPYLSYFTERIKYLENDVPTLELIEPKSHVEAIFKSIEDIEKVYVRCKNEKNKPATKKSTSPKK